MDKHKSFIIIDQTKCTSCPGLICVGVCPQGVLEADEANKPQVADEVQCTRCGVCVNLCPAKAITVNPKQ